MIVVSGTGRSGTSMWMQVLAQAGLPILGEAFPGGWKELFGDANPRGFFESTLVSGINFTTNPDPVSGVLLDVDAGQVKQTRLAIDVGPHARDDQVLHRHEARAVQPAATQRDGRVHASHAELLGRRELPRTKPVS